MTRVPRPQVEQATTQEAPVGARAARADNRLCWRGAMFVQKLWHTHWHSRRVDAPLPAIRGKR